MQSNRITINNLVQSQIEHEHKNPKGALYCVTCGASLTEPTQTSIQVCSACRHPVLPEYVYCGYCGVELQDSDQAENYISGKVDAQYFEAVKTSIQAVKLAAQK